MKQTILPDRLLSCRNNLGLTQSEAAELIGITQPAYQRYEAGVSIIEQCKGLSNNQLEEILNNIAKNKNP